MDNHISIEKNELHINITKEKRFLYNIFLDIALNSNGIIYGGFVRNEIIVEHYKKLYYKKNTNINFWDTSFDPETKYRILIPNDLDVFFNNTGKFNNFITEIKKKSIKFNGNINLYEVRSIHYSGINGENFKQFKMNISFYIGKTFIFKGYKITIKLDILVNNVNIIEPPFNNLDFFCNSFIMYKNNNKNEIRLSNNTGTPIDDMNFIEKNMVTAKIMKDILSFKTIFCRNIDNQYTENINTYRILKMIKSNISWSITNIPFNIILSNDNSIDNDLSCDICQELLKNNVDISKLVHITNITKEKTNILHINCFIRHMENECRRNVNICRCPRRSEFNFKDCYKNIDYDGLSSI